MKTTYIRRIINLEKTDFSIIQNFARQKGLGGKGFSAALRMIIREWHAAKETQSPQTQPSSTVSA